MPVAPRARGSAAATFLYPALPRAFKNIELLCLAAEHLETDSSWRSTVILTVEGTENRYAKWLKKRFGRLRTVRFAGRQTREQMHHLYEQADCLLFPSRLETWGLPISEAKKYGLPMLVADLPYAKETVGNYAQVEFIDVDDHRSLAVQLLAFQRGALQLHAARLSRPQEPFAPDWASLIIMLTQLVK
jgi:glycosyltransferase involved in cell wall biosynthesis